MGIHKKAFDGLEASMKHLHDFHMSATADVDSDFVPYDDIEDALEGVYDVVSEAMARLNSVCLAGTPSDCVCGV